jgi:uncharacterized FAD-dependent dehydrogenase
MFKQISLALSPAEAADEKMLKAALATAVGLHVPQITGYRVRKRSIDARSRSKGVQIVQQIDTWFDEPPTQEALFDPELRDVHNAPSACIVGAGPAGLFAALKLISLGIKPILFERGKDVRARRRDLAAMNKVGIVNPESNYCFGEGGAGTYSDGKLYTRSTKRGDVLRLLKLFVHFGADPSILFDAHPHIGTNKLPQIITAMREAVIECGGEVHFDTKLTQLIIADGALQGLVTADGTRYDCKAMILATGHSARDVFQLLHDQKLEIEAKPFALGVRIEHPQELIDSIQYHCALRGEYLPPASYSLVAQEQGRGVFSFCMCPGGIIAPASTAPGEIVVNGWSPSKRNNPFANSGTVVAVSEIDFAKAGFTGPLAAMQYQSMVEQAAFREGGGALKAPAQRMVDYLRGKRSNKLPDCSYLPGVRSAMISDVLPMQVDAALSEAIKTFGQKMKGYISDEAILVATESRTSSPVRIPRDAETLQHPQAKGLFPCAEGAGYAGGIMSAGIDGERCAMAVAKHLGY